MASSSHQRNSSTTDVLLDDSTVLSAREAVVVDLGAGYLKCGFAGELRPRVVLPYLGLFAKGTALSAANTEPRSSLPTSSSANSVLPTSSSSESQEPASSPTNANMPTKSSADPGLPTCSPRTALLWKHVAQVLDMLRSVYAALLVDCRDQPLFVSVAADADSNVMRTAVYYVGLCLLRVPFVCMYSAGNDGYLYLSSRRPTRTPLPPPPPPPLSHAVVLDIGFSSSRGYAMIDGCVNRHSCVVGPVGARTVHTRLQQILGTCMLLRVAVQRLLRVCPEGRKFLRLHTDRCDGCRFFAGEASSSQVKQTMCNRCAALWRFALHPSYAHSGPLLCAGSDDASSGSEGKNSETSGTSGDDTNTTSRQVPLVGSRPALPWLEMPECGHIVCLPVPCPVPLSAFPATKGSTSTTTSTTTSDVSSLTQSAQAFRAIAEAEVPDSDEQRTAPPPEKCQQCEAMWRGLCTPVQLPAQACDQILIGLTCGYTPSLEECVVRTHSLPIRVPAQSTPSTERIAAPQRPGNGTWASILSTSEPRPAPSRAATGRTLTEGMLVASHHSHAKVSVLVPGLVVARGALSTLFGVNARDSVNTRLLGGPVEPPVGVQGSACRHCSQQSLSNIASGPVWEGGGADVARIICDVLAASPAEHRRRLAHRIIVHGGLCDAPGVLEQLHARLLALMGRCSQQQQAGDSERTVVGRCGPYAHLHSLQRFVRVCPVVPGAPTHTTTTTTTTSGLSASPPESPRVDGETSEDKDQADLVDASVVSSLPFMIRGFAALSLRCAVALHPLGREHKDPADQPFNRMVREAGNVLSFAAINRRYVRQSAQDEENGSGAPFPFASEPPSDSKSQTQPPSKSPQPRKREVPPGPGETGLFGGSAVMNLQDWRWLQQEAGASGPKDLRVVSEWEAHISAKKQRSNTLLTKMIQQRLRIESLDRISHHLAPLANAPEL